MIKDCKPTIALRGKSFDSHPAVIYFDILHVTSLIGHSMGHICWVKVPLVATIGLCRIAVIILPSAYICLAMVSNAVVTVCGTNMLTLHIASFQLAQRAATKATLLSVLVSYGVVLKSKDEL